MKERGFKYILSKDRKILYLILSIVLVSIFSLTVVYAVLSTTLNITGSTEIASSSWDIHLANVNVKEGSVEANDPEISGNSSVSFDVDLTLPGDFYEFTVDVVNDGSIDAMIDSVVKTPELTTEQAKYIKYEITYENGESINEKQTLKKETTTSIKVRIEYRKDLSASDLPSTTTELTLGLTLVYVQSDGSGTDVKNNGVVIPRDYVRLNYLQSTGTQYIDTGLVFTDIKNTDVGISIEAADFTNAGETTGRVFGGSEGTSNYIGARYPIPGKSTLEVYKRTKYTSPVRIYIDDVTSAEIEFIGNQVFMDGTPQGTFNNIEENTSSLRTCTLFAYNTNTLQISQIPLKIKYFWVKVGGELVMNMLPVKSSQNELGMYDTVSQTFFPNAGTGEFIGG